MSHSIMPSAPVELTDLELDAVAGGARAGLIAVDVNVSRNDIIGDITVEDINVAVAALSAGVIRQR